MKVLHFNTPTRPTLPYVRKLNEQEVKVMFKHFPHYSFSHVDSNNRILLGGGEGDIAMSYITEDFLNSLVKLEDVNNSN